MSDRRVLIVAATSAFTLILTATVCAVLATTDSVTTNTEAIAMTLTATGSLLLVGAVYALTLIVAQR